jgi:hypothetical protein
MSATMILLVALGYSFVTKEPLSWVGYRISTRSSGRIVSDYSTSPAALFELLFTYFLLNKLSVSMVYGSFYAILVRFIDFPLKLQDIFDALPLSVEAFHGVVRRLRFSCCFFT